ncbi:glycosyltransferase family 2 protein [Phenylobacterium sp.]|uniref:glycosyltransferase family 2 protein n=1 Tax=Phenylobacterium sp. TaxID=1871053 RepID=UPI00286DD995|nr:glycosyltransferase family 2 protein [Phenylobacterium sp.]
MSASVVSVAVCTYRRPEVVATLASIARQQLPEDVTIQVVVADNDTSREAEARVLAAADLNCLPVTYVHAPERNICVARNACLDAASGDWLAFLDDDETAGPGWLAALLSQAQQSGFDAVLGPVKATYPPQAPSWLVAADLHSTAPTFTNGQILKGYAGNVLIRRSAIDRYSLRFDPALGRMGGEDDAFFYRLTDGGGSIGFAPDAVAYEPVAPARLSLGWLLQRSFRTGQTHGSRLLGRQGWLGRVVQIAMAGAKVILCLGVALARVRSVRSRNRWLVRGALHAGAVARLAGLGVLKLY